jgi:hypothetical protein
MTDDETVEHWAAQAARKKGLHIDGRGSNQKYSVFRHEWRKCVMADKKTNLTAFDKNVAVVICDAINDKTECWRMSDEWIAFMTGKPGAANRVWASRNRLRKGGWLDWTRTRDANVYRLCRDNVMEVLDEIMRHQNERKARRNGGSAYKAKG